VLTPTEQQWRKAAEILNRLRRREHDEAAKLLELAFDVLIVLSARSIGAGVITTNHVSFLAIQSEFEFKAPEDFPKHSPLRFETPLSLKKGLFISLLGQFCRARCKVFLSLDNTIKAFTKTSLIIREVACDSPGMRLVFPLCSNHTRTGVHGLHSC
jgi:hypothetical protein